MATAVEVGRLSSLREATASPVLRTEPASGLGPNGRVPHGAGDWPAHCRKRDAIQAVRDRFYREWLKLSADMAAEIARIEREGV